MINGKHNEKVTSDQFPIKNGVRQGAILSPILFNFYINSVLKQIRSSGAGCRLGFQSCNVLGYADDIAIMAPSHSYLQALRDIAYMIGLYELDLVINFSKSQALVFKFLSF